MIDNNKNNIYILIQQPINDAQMLAAWLLSIKGAHNWDCIAMAW